MLAIVYPCGMERTATCMTLCSEEDWEEIVRSRLHHCLALISSWRRKWRNVSKITAGPRLVIIDAMKNATRSHATLTVMTARWESTHGLTALRTSTAGKFL